MWVDKKKCEYTQHAQQESTAGNRIIEGFKVLFCSTKQYLILDTLKHVIFLQGHI